jgi:hypothetical protein
MSNLYPKNPSISSRAVLLLLILLLLNSSLALSADYTLTVTTVEAGVGTVNSTPSGISCQSAVSGGCNAIFNDVDPVTLLASPDWKSLFTGWGGACSGTGDCVLTLTAGTEVTATFSPNFQAMVMGMSTTEYSTLTETYANAADDKIVAAHVYTFMEDLLLDRPISIKLYGGKGDMYLLTAGFTTLQGTLEIQQGSVETDSLIIQ